MNELLLINPKRKKQPYLVNPHNPWDTFTVPSRKVKEFRSGRTGRFFDAPSWARGKKKKVSRKSKAGHRAALKKRASRKLFGAALAAHQKKLGKIPGLVKKSIGANTMKKKSHKKSRKSVRKNSWFGQPIRHAKASRKGWRRGHKGVNQNPFNLKSMGKGFVDTNLLIDGSLVVGGMLVTTIAMDFAGQKVAFLSTPIGKGVGKVGLGLLVKAVGGRMVKSPMGHRVINGLAIGIIASAVKDAAEIILPKIGYAGGVKMLGMDSGYSGEASLSAGYSGDQMGDAVETESEYAF